MSSSDIFWPSDLEETAALISTPLIHKDSNLSKNRNYGIRINETDITSCMSSDMDFSETSGNIFKGTFPQILAVLAGGLTIVSDGMQFGWTGSVLPILLKNSSTISVVESQGEWLESTLLIGSFFGLWITMHLVDTIGRKTCIMVASFVAALAWIAIALAPRVEYIYLARLFAGLAGNLIFIVLPIYVAEIAEQKIRGFLITIIFLMAIIGILVIYCVAPFIPIYAHCIIGAILNVIQLLIFPFMPESPYFLFYKNQLQAAEDSLKQLRSKDADINKELENIKVAIIQQKTERGGFIDLFLVPSNRKAGCILAVLGIAQHFSGITVFIMNIHLILEAAGSAYVDSRVATVLFSVIMLLSATITLVSVDRFGRRILLILSCLFSATSLLTLALYFSLKNNGFDTTHVSWIPIASIMMYACSFKLGLGIVPLLLSGELFSVKVKAIGTGLIDGIFILASLLSLELYQRLRDLFGIEYPFYLFSGFCYCVAIFSYLYIPETKGKTLGEIQAMLKGEHIVNSSCKE